MQLGDLMFHAHICKTSRLKPSEKIRSRSLGGSQQF